MVFIVIISFIIANIIIIIILTTIQSQKFGVNMSYCVKPMKH